MPKGEKFKHTFEHVKSIFEERDFELLSKEYNGYKDKLIFRDKEGYLYCMGFTIFRGSKGVPYKFHTNNPCTIDNIKLFLSRNYPQLTLLSKEYIRNNKNLLFLTDEGYLCLTPLDVLIQRHPPSVFHKRNKYTIHNIRVWIEKNNPKIKLIGDTYISNVSLLDLQCTNETCREFFKTSWNCISAGQGCPFCAGKRVGDSNSFAARSPQLLKEWHPTKNKTLTPHSVTYGSHKLAWWVCSKCNHEWEAEIKERSIGRGCVKCNVSQGENMVFDILNSYRVENSPQHKFKGCVYIGQLRFDFYIPSHRVAIEVQGRHHYMPIDFSGRGEEFAIEQFEEQKIKDQIKRDYCEKNNIKLIEIPYWDFDNMEDILIEELGLELNNT